MKNKEELTEVEIYNQIISLTDFINNRSHLSTIDKEVYDLATKRLKYLIELTKKEGLMGGNNKTL